MRSTILRQCRWLLGFCLKTHPPWDSSRIPIQGASISCRVPTCLHHDLSTEVFGQDIQLLLLQPLTCPASKQKPVLLGWCARLNSSRWPSHHSGQGGEPVVLLLPASYRPDSPHHHNGKLYNTCISYFSYHPKVHDTHQGLHVASLHTDHGPQDSLSLDLLVEPILVHLFSIHSKWLAITHSTINLFWSLLRVSPRKMAYRLLDVESGFWSTSYSPYVLKNNFSVGLKLTTTGTSETVEDSDSVFVQVGSGSLVAIIAGGNFRTVGFSDQWTLDGSYSYDTEAALPSERITFTCIEALQQFHSSKTELREILLNKSAEIPTTGILELTQMVSGISQITQEAAEVNRKTQLLALRKLKELSKELKRYRDKNLGSRDIEVLSTGIFEGLSNILKASLLDYRNVHKNGVTDTLSITEILAEIILQGKVPGENETVMETSDWTIRFRKDAKWSVPGTFPHRGVCKNCFYSKINQEGHDELPADAEVSTVVFAFHKNPFPWLPFSKDISTTVTGFKMTGTRSDGNIVGVIPDVAEMIMTRKDEGPAIFELNIGHNRKLHKKTGGFSFEVHRNSKEVFIQIVTERKLTFQLFVYLGLNINHPPIASFSGSHNKHTATTGKKSKGHGCAAQDSSIFCLSRSLLKSMFQGNSAEKWNMSIILQSDPFLWDPRVQVVGVRLFTADCLYLDGIQSQWKEGVCDLGPQTSWEKLHCICKAKQRTPRTASPRPRRTSKNDMKFLAGKVSVHPDLKEVPLVRVNNNPVTTVTVLFIFVVYICLAVWTMRKDRADVKSVDHIIVLSDNDPYDQVCYFVTIYTGSRFGAGTTADVFIQLIGHRDASDIHCLRHPEYPVLVRGAVNTFLLTSKNDLGDIYSFRAWHNHGGSSPNWFLSRVKVQNVFTKQSWKFICRKWFALNKDDGLIERSFVATHPTTPLSKMDFFWINLACELAETHLWLSVFAHISTSSLKRLHRLSSCLAMLLCTLLFNIIFFSANKDELVASQQPLYLRSLLTGIHSAFIFFPLQILITVLFKYSQQKPLQQGPFNTQHQGRSAFMSRNLRNWKERLQKWYLAETASKGLGDSFHKSLSRTPDSYGLEQLKRKSWGQAAKKQSNCTVSEGDANIIATEEDMVHDAQAPNNFNNRHEKKDPFPQVTPLNSPIVLSNKNPQIIIPWWYAYVLWTLVLVTSTVSSFFIIFYGLSYDYETSFEWLIASSVSFCESVFLLQTLNVAFFSALRTLYPKYCDNIPWSKRETYLEIKLDNKTMDADEMRELHYELVRLRGTKQYQPLEEDEVALLKKKQKVEQQAFVFIKAVIMSSYEDMKQPVYEEPSEEAEVVKFLCHKIRKIWFLIRCKTPPEHDAELFIRFLYGHSERRNSRHLGLKARKINGRKMVYLVV
uniref:Uncharacterized protein n=1 Tax=Sphaerodactylus townsendi TaxID=933632 RepID=A0ACB8EBW0_9SAUR